MHPGPVLFCPLTASRGVDQIWLTMRSKKSPGLLQFGIRVVALVVGAGVPAQSVDWQPWSPASSPTTRMFPVAAYDAARQRLVLFGGGASSTTLGTGSSDTWTWDGTAWNPAFPSTSPPARYNHAMVYDSHRQRIVLFGGVSSVELADTWEWDGSNWLARFSLSYPPARSRPGLAYDVARQRTVLYGGSGALGALADTWEWNGATWVQRSPTQSPGLVPVIAMAYDIARQETVLLSQSAPPVPTRTWIWDGTDWQDRTPSLAPSPRWSPGFAFDSATQTLIFHGGNVFGPGNHTDTWMWDGAQWTQLVATGGSPSLSGVAMAYCDNVGRIVAFGANRWLTPDVPETWAIGAPPSPGVARSTAFGTGCGVPPLAMVPDPNARPIVGSVASNLIQNSPTPFGGVALGSSRLFSGPFQLPVDLGGVGMAGCMLWQSAEVIGLPLTAGGATGLSFSASIPNDPGMIGAWVFLQAYALAPGANALDIVSSNGVEWRIGNL